MVILVAKNNVRRLGYQDMYVEVLAENNALPFYRKYGGGRLLTAVILTVRIRKK